MIFFNPDTWPGKEITFPDDDDDGHDDDDDDGGGGPGGVWVLGQKLNEMTR
jgi:hypothetical protein